MIKMFKLKNGETIIARLFDTTVFDTHTQQFLLQTMQVNYRIQYPLKINFTNGACLLSEYIPMNEFEEKLVVQAEDVLIVAEPSKTMKEYYVECFTATKNKEKFDNTLKSKESDTFIFQSPNNLQ